MDLSHLSFAPYGRSYNFLAAYNQKILSFSQLTMYRSRAINSRSQLLAALE